MNISVEFEDEHVSLRINRVSAVFPITLIKISIRSDFRKQQFHIQVKQNPNYYIPFDREFQELQNDTKLWG